MKDEKLTRADRGLNVLDMAVGTWNGADEENKKKELRLRLEGKKGKKKKWLPQWHCFRNHTRMTFCRSGLDSHSLVYLASIEFKEPHIYHNLSLPTDKYLMVFFYFVDTSGFEGEVFWAIISIIFLPITAASPNRSLKNDAVSSNRILYPSIFPRAIHSCQPRADIINSMSSSLIFLSYNAAWIASWRYSSFKNKYSEIPLPVSESIKEKREVSINWIINIR